MIRIVLGAAALLAAVLAPSAGSASCEPGGRPGAEDIEFIEVLHHSFPIAREPEFHLTIGRSSRYDPKLGRVASSFAVQLRALGLQPVPRGTYTLDGDPSALLAALASEIERANFFTMHFTPTDRMHLEGPSDFIRVMRCGVRTDLATLPDPFMWLTYSDANGQRFFALIDRLGAIVSAQRWTRIPDATPSPSPSP